MQFRRFLGNFAKTYLAIGALSVSAYAGADDFHNFNNCGPSYNAPIGCGPSYNAPIGCGPSYNAPIGCDSGSCCGHPVNPAPELGWAYNPPAYARCGCDTGCNQGGGSFLDSFAFRADFLWWRACEEGVQLGHQETLESFTPTTGTSVINRSRDKKPNFKYDPGFRIGVASACGCDCWDFAVNWAHFHTKANVNGASDATAGVTFISDWERIVGANPMRSSGRYALNLDLVDIEFGRKFYVSNCFVLRPQFGLRIARINQSYRVESESNVAGSTPPVAQFQDFISDVKSRSNFISVGPRVGADIELQLCNGLSLFGCASGSIVFGKFDNHSREHYEDFGTGTIVRLFDYEAKSSAHRCSRTITDLAFGIKWDRCFEWCNRSHPVSLAFAWEHHAFYDMNNFNFASNGVEFTGATASPNGSNNRKHGDLNTQGLTVSVAFGF